MSDHGFEFFNERGGEKDHSKDGLIKGLHVKKASDVVEFIDSLIQSGKLGKEELGHTRRI